MVSHDELEYQGKALNDALLCGWKNWSTLRVLLKADERAADCVLALQGLVVLGEVWTIYGAQRARLLQKLSPLCAC